jgi:gliding motility-associated-like protein
MRLFCHKNWLLVLAGLLAIHLNGFAQEAPEYLMTDTLVTDCDGFLFDSGGDGEEYGNNENLVFTVETGGVSIEVSFLSEVCIENGFDFLYIYDGTSTGAPLLATINGTGFIPPGVVATSGAVTFQFTSDQSAAYCGFHIFWNTIVGPPDPPLITVPTEPLCNSNSFTVNFSYPIGCDWLAADSVTVIGSSEIEVIAASVLCTNGEGSTAQITLSEPFAYNCNYSVGIRMGIPDVCDSIWIYQLATTFDVTNCGVLGNIEATQDIICANQCVELTAVVEGCNEHSFLWDQALPPTAGPHQVCIEESTTYTVVITEIASGQSTTESFTLEVLNPTILLNDTLLCQTASPFTLTASTPGGTWLGDGVDELTGFFNPELANVGINTVYYGFSEFCYDSLFIEIAPIDAGGVLAACPGAPEFLLEPNPPSGLWTGDFVTPEGLFNPSTEGSYELIYTLAGCSDTLLMNVADITGVFELDTLCQSNFPDTLEFSPLGGLWTGPGIIDSLLGVFAPEEVPGGTYNLLYAVQGCDQLFTVTVKEIFTGSRVRSSCPEQAPFVPTPDFSPTGGYWEGDGIQNSETGLYAPGSLPDDYWTALIYYAPNGCSDTIYYYNRQTSIPIDTLWWCADDEGLLLDEENTQRTPFGGGWTGTGVVQEDDLFGFIPALAGNGEHWITYTANGCADSLLMIVHPTTFEVGPFGFCATEDAVLLNSAVNAGGTWLGSGVIDSTTGLFDPGAANPGENEVIWSTPAGCTASVFVTVEAFQQATISGLEAAYCFENSDFPVTYFPEGGSAGGVATDGAFNPALAGEGEHLLSYSYAGAYCSSDTTILVFVYPSLEVALTAIDATLCPGSGTQVSGSAAGGGEATFYTYTWSDGLFGVPTNSVSPAQSQYYYLTLDDGCSDPVTDSIWIAVLPPIEPLVTTSDLLCFGEEGAFASAELPQDGSFEITWTGPGETDANSFNTSAGSLVELAIVDVVEGCSFDSLILVPSYTPVSALFSTNPNASCIPWDSQPIEIIDFSQNGITGLWDLGNGDVNSYSAGEVLTVSYPEPGNYTATLLLYNEGDCLSTYTTDICILPPTPIFIPDIFSPNGDGLNDILFVRGQGILELSFTVYDRWGELVFETTDVARGWDGQFRGETMPSGSYIWLLRARLNDGLTLEERGNIVLIR